MKKSILQSKALWLFVFLFGLGTATMAQQKSLTLEASQLYSSFKFTDSQGNELNNEYSGIFTGAYGAGFRMTTENGIMARAGLGMRKGGATLVYDAINYEWHLHYAEVKLGGGYMLQMGRINPYLNVSGYFGYLLKAYQTLNNENFDIKEAGELEKTDYGVFITPGAQIKLNDAMSAYAEFNYMMGLSDIDPDEGQIAKNNALGVTLGLSFNIE